MDLSQSRGRDCSACHVAEGMEKAPSPQATFLSQIIPIHLDYVPFLCNCEQTHRAEWNWKSIQFLKRHKVAAGVPNDNSFFFLVNIQLLLGDLGEKSHLMPALDISIGFSSCPNFEACFGNHLKNWEVEWTVTLRCDASLMFQKDGELPRTRVCLLLSSGKEESVSSFPGM